MDSALVSATLQGALLSMTSNVMAQVISSYKHDTPFSLSLAPIIKFAAFSIISNPPNIVWQNYLEGLYPTSVQALPAKTESPKSNPALSKQATSYTNVMIKFALDQTFGAVVNTLMFLVYMGYMNSSPTGKNNPLNSIVNEIQEKFYPMIMGGMKLWPVFSIVSFLWIPVEKRVVAGCMVGVVWGIYLSLLVE
ncbi:hypothetical protein BCR34DRAFT_472986 [Clohesyomyces aquaticus]|uniref:Integral membrane protein-like protein n=1 Tax=Clohesyomyces aquaticus TaxID=1231657 RepID=A0A1Y2A8L3_9PLEO|nr:hypothetical protein BCR34DRAFT_472986 [Clohesyomyces aquaticus]